MRPPACFDDLEARKLLNKLCDQHEIDMRLLKELCEVAQEHSGSGRREGVFYHLTTCIDSYLARTEGPHPAGE